MLFSQTSLPQALLINKLRAKCPGSCFWHLSWNSYIVFYLFLPTLNYVPSQAKLCWYILQYFRQFFFTTHVHRVPEPCGFLTQKTTLIFFGPPKFLSCFRFYQKKTTNLKFLIGLLFLLAILYNLTRLPQMPSSIHFVVTFWSTTSTRLNVETCKLMVVRDFTIGDL